MSSKTIPNLIILVVVTLAILWLIGEFGDLPYLRRIAAPLFAVVVGVLAYGAAALGTSFNDSIRYSGATKEFVSALVAAIDRGDVESAHDELRKFDEVSIETYEGGAFLRWLKDPVSRLNVKSTQPPDHAPDSGSQSIASSTTSDAE